MTNIQEAVALGVETLDRYDPDWRSHIDTKVLDMGAPCSCIAGQLVPGVWFTHAIIRIADNDGDYNAQWARSHGFEVDPPGTFRSALQVIDDYAALTAEWREVLAT